MRLPLYVLPSLLLFSSCGDKEPVEEKPLKTRWDIKCEDACPFANDGECDDGGIGSITDICNLGKDCSDCGQRYYLEVDD